MPRHLDSRRTTIRKWIEKNFRPLSGRRKINLDEFNDWMDSQRRGDYPNFAREGANFGRFRGLARDMVRQFNLDVEAGHGDSTEEEGPADRDGPCPLRDLPPPGPETVQGGALP